MPQNSPTAGLIACLQVAYVEHYGYRLAVHPPFKNPGYGPDDMIVLGPRLTRSVSSNVLVPHTILFTKQNYHAQEYYRIELLYQMAQQLTVLVII